ncbi:hypothetical protein ABQF17_17935 [Mycolicibacterium elephantis]
MTALWFGPLPVEAITTVIRAAEVVANGDQVGGICVLADSGVDPQWLCVAAIRCLGTLFAGEGMSSKFDRLRAELLRVADATNAPTAEVDLVLEIAAAAQFWACGDVVALRAVADESPFSMCDQASVAVQLVGQLLDDEIGPETFDKLKHRFGIEDG